MLDGIRDWKKRVMISVLAGMVFCAGWAYGLMEWNQEGEKQVVEEWRNEEQGAEEQGAEEQGAEEQGVEEQGTKEPGTEKQVAENWEAEEQIIKEKPQLLAWWGTMYPEFCFGEGSKREEMGNTGIEDSLGKGEETGKTGAGESQGSGKEVKISWWFWEKLEELWAL